MERRYQQPQEMSLIAQFLEQKKQQEVSFIGGNEGRELQEEMLAAAKKKIVGFKQLKTEVDEKMSRVFEMIYMIRQTLIDNVVNDETESGFLTHGVDEYLECLKLKDAELEKLFEKDFAHWT